MNLELYSLPSPLCRPTQTGISMPTDSRQPSRPKPLVPRQKDRRQVNSLRGVPLIGGLGLVFNDRRTYRERRRSRRGPKQAAPCALLRGKETDRTRQGFLGSLSSGWRQTGLGAWIRRYLKHPWRSKARPPAERP